MVRDPNGPPATPAGTDGSGGGGGGAAGAAGRVVSPLEKGTISDWDVLEACLDHVLYERVGADCCQGWAASTQHENAA